MRETIMAIKGEVNKSGDTMKVVTLERPDSDRSVYNLALDVLLKRSSGKNRSPAWSLICVLMAMGKAFFAMQKEEVIGWIFLPLLGVVFLLVGLGSYQLMGAEYGALDVALVGLANFSNGEREVSRFSTLLAHLISISICRLQCFWEDTQ